jgi:small conductance mechanosensitive channel
MPVQDLIIDLAVRYGFQVLGAIAIIGVGALVARWVGRLVDGHLTRRQMEPPMRQLIGRVLRLVVMLFALVVALDKFGFQIAPRHRRGWPRRRHRATGRPRQHHGGVEHHLHAAVPRR